MVDGDNDIGGNSGLFEKRDFVGLEHKVRIAPREQERAAEREAELTPEANVSPVAFHRPDAAHGSEKNKPCKPLVSHGLSNSRGGTRTRDPGIMSAVL